MTFALRALRHLRASVFQTPRAARPGRQDAGTLRYLAGGPQKPGFCEKPGFSSRATGAGPGYLLLLGRRPAPVGVRLCRPLRRGYGHNHPQTDIVVEVVGYVPVTDGAAGVPLIVVPGTATHHARLRPGPENAARGLRGLLLSFLSRFQGVCAPRLEPCNVTHRLTAPVTDRLRAERPHPSTTPGSLPRLRSGCSHHSASDFCHPPSKRPISLTMRMPYAYWPRLISSRSRLRRR